MFQFFFISPLAQQPVEEGEDPVPRDIDAEKKAVVQYYMKNLHRIPPISSKLLVAFFMEDSRWKVLFRKENILRAIIPDNGDGACSIFFLFICRTIN